VVFIDGDHTAEGVKADLEFWVDRLTPDGVLLGHDWDDGRVRGAVEAFAGQRGVGVHVHPGTYIWQFV
jgi:hypothetical protein